MIRLIFFLPLLTLVSCAAINSRNIIPEPKAGTTEPAGITQTIEPALNEYNTLIQCIRKSSVELTSGFSKNTVMAVIKISSAEETEAEFAEEMLILTLVQSGQFRIVERKDLDVIRQEQNFQLSGDVDDETAVSIGKMAGAGIVITGSILPYGEGKYLNLKALDVETAQIRAASSGLFSSF